MSSHQTPRTPPQKESKEPKKRKYQNNHLSPVSLMMYFFVEFAGNLALMIASLPSSSYHNTDRYRKLAALYSEVLLTVNGWNLDIGEKSFACCITPACDFIEILLNIVQENIKHFTDIQLCELCDETETKI